jgi:hypothetical protein
MRMGDIIRQGSTRNTVLLWPLALKFARHKYGERCNKHETELYYRNRHKPHRRSMLCPVLWCSPSGKLLVMRYAATPITRAQADERKANAWSEWAYEGSGDDEHPFEWKENDWGVLRGKVIAVDYATTAE